MIRITGVEGRRKEGFGLVYSGDVGLLVGFGLIWSLVVFLYGSIRQSSCFGTYNRRSMFGERINGLG